MALVQIGNRAPKQLPLRTEAAITSDKLFSLGMIAGFVGSVAVGAYLWLGLNGQAALPASYASLRALHAYLQLYYFMGAFIAGFLLQGSPKILESRVPVHRAARHVFPLLVGGLLLCVAGFLPAARMVTCVAYLLALGTVMPVLLHCAPENRLRMAAPCAVSLASLAVSVTIDASDPLIGLAVFWWGVVSVILGIAQQFIQNILGGSKLSRGQAQVVSVLYLLSGSGLVAAAAGSGGWGWTLFSWSSLLCLVLFVWFTRLQRGFSKGSAFSRCFAACWVWALAGALLALGGASQADLVLHAWGTGFAVTMIIAVSSKVVGHVTDFEVLPAPLFYTVCLIWQVVPLGRGLRYAFGLPPWFSWCVAIAATLVLLIWIGRIATAIVKLVTRLRAERIAAGVR